MCAKQLPSLSLQVVHNSVYFALVKQTICSGSSFFYSVAALPVDSLCSMLLSATVSIIVVERDLLRTLGVLRTILCSWLFSAEVATIVVIHLIIQKHVHSFYIWFCFLQITSITVRTNVPLFLWDIIKHCCRLRCVSISTNLQHRHTFHNHC